MKRRFVNHGVISQLFGSMSITNWLILINVVLFFLFYILIAVDSSFINYIALKPSDLFAGRVWTLLTSMFMHGGIGHLFVNMFSLMFIGNFLERIIGRKRFFWFYIVSGLIAGLFFAVLAQFFGFGFFERIFSSPDTLAVGASGAIFGLLGVLAILTPKAKVYLILGPLIAIILQSLLGLVYQGTIFTLIGFLVTIYFFISIFAMLSFNPRMIKIAFPVEMPFWFLPIIAIVPLIIIGLFFPLPIGNTAHLGGLIAGLFYGAYLRNKYAKKVNILNRMIR